MGIEGEANNRNPEPGPLFPGGLEDRLVAEMDAIKIPKRHHGGLRIGIIEISGTEIGFHG
jgi:hypothetical protein